MLTVKLTDDGRPESKWNRQADRAQQKQEMGSPSGDQEMARREDKHKTKCEMEISRMQGVKEYLAGCMIHEKGVWPLLRSHWVALFGGQR